MASSKAKAATTPAALTPLARHDNSVAERVKDSDLRTISTFEDALRVATESYGDVRDISEDLGNGFMLLRKDDLEKLVGVPMVLIYWTFNDGDFGEFASVALVTADNRKIVLNDGSSGVCDQLREISDRSGRYGAYRVNNGLRVSVYDTCGECDRPRPTKMEVCSHCGDTGAERHKGKTAYLDTSA